MVLGLLTLLSKFTAVIRSCRETMLIEVNIISSRNLIDKINWSNYYVQYGSCTFAIQDIFNLINCKKVK